MNPFGWRGADMGGGNMSNEARVRLIESYGNGAYCSYISGHCAAGGKVQECAKRNPEECRNCRQRNEKEDSRG